MTIQSQLDQVLAPCPFCGCAMRFRKALHVSDGNTDSIIHAEPTNCGMVVFDMGTTDESIIAAWNNSISTIRAAVGGEAVVFGHYFRDAAGNQHFHTGATVPPFAQSDITPLYTSPPATAQAVAWVSSEAASLLRKLPSCAAAFRSFDVNAASVKRDDRSVPIYLQPPATVDVVVLREVMEFADRCDDVSEESYCAEIRNQLAALIGEKA